MRSRRNDRTAPELRNYLRAEWGAESPSALAWTQLPTLRARLGDWFQRRKAARSPPHPVAAKPATSARPASMVPDASRVCPHLVTEDLGFGGAEFLRCAVCGDILVEQRGRRWRIRPEAAAPEDLDCG